MPARQKADRNIAILKERLNGDRLTDIAIRHDISTPRVSQIIYATVVYIWERNSSEMFKIFDSYSKLKYIFRPNRTYKIRFQDLYDACWLPDFNVTDFAMNNDIPVGYCYSLAMKYKARRYIRTIERYYSEMKAAKNTPIKVRPLNRKGDNIYV